MAFAASHWSLRIGSSLQPKVKGSLNTRYLRWWTDVSSPDHNPLAAIVKSILSLFSMLSFVPGRISSRKQGFNMSCVFGTYARGKSVLHESSFTFGGTLALSETFPGIHAHRVLFDTAKQVKEKKRYKGTSNTNQNTVLFLISRQIQINYLVIFWFSHDLFRRENAHRIIIRFQQQKWSKLIESLFCSQFSFGVYS